MNIDHWGPSTLYGELPPGQRETEFHSPDATEPVKDESWPTVLNCREGDQSRRCDQTAATEGLTIHNDYSDEVTKTKAPLKLVCFTNANIISVARRCRVGRHSSSFGMLDNLALVHIHRTALSRTSTTKRFSQSPMTNTKQSIGLWLLMVGIFERNMEMTERRTSWAVVRRKMAVWPRVSVMQALSSRQLRLLQIKPT